MKIEYHIMPIVIPRAKKEGRMQPFKIDIQFQRKRIYLEVPPPRAATLETSHIDKLLRRKRTWRPTFLIKELAKSLAVLRRFHTARRQIKPLVQHPYVTRYNFLILSYPWF